MDTGALIRGLRNLLAISDEAYQVMSQYSFVLLVIIFRIPAIVELVSLITTWTLDWLARPFGWHYSVS